jgi:hypothetical protein
MKGKKKLICTVMNFSDGVVTAEKIYSNTEQEDPFKLSEKEFQKRYNMSKERFRELDAIYGSYGANGEDGDTGVVPWEEHTEEEKQAMIDLAEMKLDSD